MSECNLASPDLLSEDIRQKIDIELTKFPSDQKQSAVMAALTIVQNKHGWLTEPLMDAIAAYLEMPRIAVYEVATFYSMYELEPVGKVKLEVCRTLTCMLRGRDEVLEHIYQRLGIRDGETTPDGKFTLKTVECLCACGGAPVMQVGPKYHEHLTPEKIDAIIAEHE
jgi:NADH-quinone oxidoreductase subunit E